MSDQYEWDYGVTGYEPRDYEQFPEGFAYSMYSGEIYPRSDWKELIELQKSNETRPLDVHKYNKVPVLNQGRYGYCWMYGCVNAVLNRYAAQGIDPVPDLNAHATAAMRKRYQNRGGFGVEAAEAIQKYGIPEYSVWPEFSNNRSLENDPDVRASCDKHKLVTFEELPREDIFDIVVSSIISPTDPSPCTLAYSHWRHLVCGLEVRYRGSGRSVEWGLGFVNSWGSKWGDGGFGVLWGSKAVPFESVSVRSVKAVKED